MSTAPFALLALAVPLRILPLKEKGGPNAEDFARAQAWAAGNLAEHGESLLYKVTDTKARAAGYDTATMFNELARTLAVLAFVPGGVRFADMAWNESREG